MVSARSCSKAKPGSGSPRSGFEASTSPASEGSASSLTAPPKPSKTWPSPVSAICSRIASTTSYRRSHRPGGAHSKSHSFSRARRARWILARLALRSEARWSCSARRSRCCWRSTTCSGSMDHPQTRLHSRCGARPRRCTCCMHGGSPSVFGRVSSQCRFRPRSNISGSAP